MFNVVLVEPEIPPNTGNIGRLCLATRSTLHLVKPFGFSLDDRQLRRAGLDYWDEVTLQLWESFDALRDFVYRSAHVGPLRDRSQWFEPIEGPILALWWIPAGHVPTVDEAIERLQRLAARGPSPEAFTFRAAFPPPDRGGEIVPALDAAFCEWASGS